MLKKIRHFLIKLLQDKDEVEEVCETVLLSEDVREEIINEAKESERDIWEDV